jgi:hypothetical protein
MSAIHPGKLRTEQVWLWYTLVWGALCGLTMLTGLARAWQDAALLMFGILVGGGAAILPFVFVAPEERALPLTQRASVKLMLSVVGFAFLYNYTQTPFFFDVLHMHYGFQSTFNIRNNPVFLYFLTIAYFATYCALSLRVLRFVRARTARSGKPLRYIAVGAVPFVIAFLETAMNANPFMASLFCYDDTRLVLGFGSFAYGLAFVCALPVWFAIDETRESVLPLWHVAIAVCAAVYLDSLALDVLRYHVAPHLTTVVENANGLRDFATSCLETFDAN